MLFWPILSPFWCPVVTVVTFSSDLSNFKNNEKNKDKKIKKIINCQKAKQSGKMKKKNSKI